MPRTIWFSRGTRQQKAYWSSLGLLLQNIGGLLGTLSFAKFAQVKAIAVPLLRFLLGRFRSFARWWCFDSCGTLIKSLLDAAADGLWPILCLWRLRYLLLPELFPTSLRSTGTSFCYNLSGRSSPLLWLRSPLVESPKALAATSKASCNRRHVGQPRCSCSAFSCCRFYLKQKTNRFPNNQKMKTPSHLIATLCFLALPFMLGVADEPAQAPEAVQRQKSREAGLISSWHKTIR